MKFSMLSFWKTAMCWLTLSTAPRQEPSQLTTQGSQISTARKKWQIWWRKSRSASNASASDCWNSSKTMICWERAMWNPPSSGPLYTLKKCNWPPMNTTCLSNTIRSRTNQMRHSWTTLLSVTRSRTSSRPKTWRRTQPNRWTRSQHRQFWTKSRNWRKQKRVSSTAACRDSAFTWDTTASWSSHSSKIKTSQQAVSSQCPGSDRFSTTWNCKPASGNSSWSTNGSKRRQRTRSTTWSLTGYYDTTRETLSEEKEGGEALIKLI